MYIGEEMFVVDVEPNFSAKDLVNEKESMSEISIAKEPEGTPVFANGNTEILAPMPGVLIQYLVDEGDNISKGQSLLILEAMKMENSIPSPVDGIVEKIYCEVNTHLSKDQLLMLISPKE